MNPKNIISCGILLIPHDLIIKWCQFRKHSTVQLDWLVTLEIHKMMLSLWPDSAVIKQHIMITLWHSSSLYSEHLGPRRWCDCQQTRTYPSRCQSYVKAKKDIKATQCQQIREMLHRIKCVAESALQSIKSNSQLEGNPEYKKSICSWSARN